MDPRIVLLDLVQFSPGIVIGGDFGRAFRPADVEADHLAAVHLGDRALLGIRILDFAQVGQPDRASAGDDDLGLRQVKRGLGIAKHAHRLLGPGDLGAATGGVEVGLAKLGVDLRCGDPLRLESGGIEDHADVAINPALAGHRGDAADTQQSARDIIVDVPA